MINCEWIRKQKKEQSAHGGSRSPKGMHTGRAGRLRVKSANTQQPCFSELCDAWLLRKRDEIRESSYIKYRAILERHIKPRLGSRRLGGICTASVDAFTQELLETDGLSVKTVHDILSVLHSVLKDTEARRPAGALAVQIRYPKGKRREMRVLTIEEQKRLVAYLLHPTDSCKFGLLLALYTGLRIGELCALRWSCIDLREQTIRIAATMQRLGKTGEGTRIVIGAPKSDSSLRTMDLDTTCALDMAQGGNIVGIACDMPYAMGYGRALMDAYACIGKECPGYVTSPSFKVTRENLLEGYRTSLGIEAPADVQAALNG